MIQLMGSLRKLNPGIRVILVNRYLRAGDQSADAQYSIGDGPESFLRIVASVLGTRTGTVESNDEELRPGDAPAPYLDRHCHL